MIETSPLPSEPANVAMNAIMRKWGDQKEVASEICTVMRAFSGAGAVRLWFENELVKELDLLSVYSGDHAAPLMDATSIMDMAHAETDQTVQIEAARLAAMTLRAFDDGAATARFDREIVPMLLAARDAENRTTRHLARSALKVAGTSASLAALAEFDQE